MLQRKRPVYFSAREQKWIAQLDISGEEGRRHYRRAKKDTRQAAVDELRLMQGERDELRAGEGPILADWLEQWRDSRHVRELAASTREWYASVCRVHIEPGEFLGRLRLRALTPAVLDNWLDTLRRRKRGARTVVVARDVLRIALNWAVQREVLERNPLDKGAEAWPKAAHPRGQPGRGHAPLRRGAVLAAHGDRHHADPRPPAR